MSFLCNLTRASISEFSHSSANHSQTVKLLKEWYENTEILINVYIKKFFELPVIKCNNDTSGLRNLYHLIQNSVRNLNEESSGYSVLLAPLINENLPLQ